MRLAILLFVGALACVVSLAAVSASIMVRARGGRDKLIESVGGLLGALLWAVFGLGAMNITQTTSCCVVRTQAPGVAFIAAAFAALMLFVALFGTISLVDVTDVRDQGAQR